jgi:hypothetical protein
MKKAGCIENSILDDYRRFSFEGYIIISHAIGQGTIEKTQKNRASQLLKAKIEKKRDIFCFVFKH